MKWRSLEEATPATEIRPLREIFAERKEAIAKYVPPETQAIHARAIAELKQESLAANILPVGAKISRIPTSGSRRQERVVLRTARQGPPRPLFHSWPLVSVLRRADGGE